MASLAKYKGRPRLACEIMPDGVTAARAAEKGPRLEVFALRRLNPGVITPGLSGPNIQDREALRAALRGALQAVNGKSGDVIVVLPDACIRVLFLDFEKLPARSDEYEPIIRLRLKKSLPFDVEMAAVSCDIRRANNGVRVVAAVSLRSIIEEYESAFRDLGYSPGVILPSSLASLGLLEGNRPTLLLKVDSINIIIAVAEKHELRLIRTLDNPQGAAVTAGELVEAVLPSIVFFEDTFAAHIEQIYLAGPVAVEQIAPLLQQHTGAEVRSLNPELTSDQNLSGENAAPVAMAGIVGALLG